MKDSGVNTGVSVAGREATGYALDHARLGAADFVNMSSTFSAGAIYSTVEDLLLWERGLFGDNLLSAASHKKMTTPFLNGYACGLHAEVQGSHKVIYHSGRVDG